MTPSSASAAAVPSSPSTLSLLQDTLSPHPHTVLAAENQLHNRDLLPGFLTQLFQIALSSPPDNHPSSPVSLAGAIYLKNLIRRAWQNVHPTPNHPHPSFLPVPDRQHIRAHIVPALAHSDPRIRAQLVEALKRIISADFPLHFPLLLQQILSGLQSNHPSLVHGALVALRALAKVYEFKSATLSARPVPPEQLHPSHQHQLHHQLRLQLLNNPQPDLSYLHQHPRQALNFLVELTFPTLLQITTALDAAIEAAPPHSPQLSSHFDMQRIVAKIFWSFTQYDIPIYLLSDLSGVFSQWMNVFLAVLRRPIIPQYSLKDQPSDEDLRCMPQWKVKQWISQIVYRLFHRYANPSRLSPNILRNHDLTTLTAFADFFRRNFASQFTVTMLQILSTDYRLISPRVASLALLYLETAVSIGLTYKVIKPTLQPLITDVIFPYLCVTDNDLALWHEDPVEYVRKTYNILEDFNTPRAAACSLLYVIVKVRRSTAVPILMNFLVSIFNDFETIRSFDPNSATQQTQQSRHEIARRKDGALLALGNVRETLAAHPQGVQQLNLLLQNHVCQDFESDIPFLRARACWLYGQFAAAETLTSEGLQRALVGVQQRLTDSEFPVRVRAAVDIRHFVQNSKSADAIAPYLPDLLDLLFSMLDDVDSTDIVATIDQLAVGFSDRIVPLALDLCKRLVQTFSRSASGGQGDEEAGFAAVQCLQALSSIATSVSVAIVPTAEKVELLAAIETELASVFNHMFEEERIEYFEESLELLATFVYHSAEDRGTMVRMMQANGISGDLSEMYRNEKVLGGMKGDVEDDGGLISPYLWSLLPRAMYAFHEWASDYSFHYMQVMDAYLSKGMRVFVELRDGETWYVELMLGMISRLWGESSGEEEEVAIQGSQLCGLLLQHCRRIERTVEEREMVGLTQMLVTRMRHGQACEEVRVALIRSLAHMLYIAPVTVLMVMDKTFGCTIEVFKVWMGMVQQGEICRRYDRKASAIALCAIVGSDWSALPGSVGQSMPEVVLGIVGLLESLERSAAEGGGEGGERREGVMGKDGDGMEGGDGEFVETDGWEEEVVEEVEEAGDGGVLTVVEDVDELLLFESVIRRMPDVAWRQLGMALAKADTLRVESALHRAAEVRGIGAAAAGAGGDGVHVT